ncbi:cache domain-containing protein [Rhizobium leguminosarum]|uniref:cache domain-containing protein n=1 Tax=Rhizobium leguminosarum TaxID=384 RepID=UPI001FDA412B|nr:cache domain-containing protein [Rhizobium leguminosarum]
MEFSTWTIKPEDEYYSGVLKSGKAIITSPYLTNMKKLVTSVSVPVKLDGKVVGMAGVDIKLDDLTASLAQMKPFEGGSVMLLASNGKWLTHPNKDNLMKDYADVGAADVKQSLADGKMRVVTGLPDGSVRLIYPFTASGMNTTWATVLDVPPAVFSAPVWQQVYNTLLGGVLILAVTLGVILLASQMLIKKPLTAVLGAVRKMADGNYKDQITQTGKKDELGSLTAALEKFRFALARGEEMQAEQEQLGQQIETERKRQSDLDNAKAEDLHHFVELVQSRFNVLAAGDLTVRRTSVLRLNSTQSGRTSSLPSPLLKKRSATSHVQFTPFVPASVKSPPHLLPRQAFSFSDTISSEFRG